MLSGIAVMGQVGIDVLNHVIPRVPLPDDTSAVWRLWLDLHDHVWPETGFRDQLRTAARRRRFLGRLRLPGDRQDVAVWQHRDVVMQQAVLIGVAEIPYHLAIPRRLLDTPGLPTTAEHRWIRLLAATEQVAVVEQVSATAAFELAFPGVHYLPLEIDEIGRKREQWIEEHVARRGLRTSDAKPSRNLLVCGGRRVGINRRCRCLRLGGCR